MGETKKTTIKKMTNGYNYKYSDLATIHEEMENQGITYYQYTEFCIEANCDYIYTVLIIDGEEQKPRRGCRVIYGDEKQLKSAAQAQGSGLTYARRYSLLMALGWATEDDDGAGAGNGSAGTSKALKMGNKLDFKQVREHLSEITSEDELNQYWHSLKLSEKQATVLKGDFAKRKATLGQGLGE